MLQRLRLFMYNYLVKKRLKTHKVVHEIKNLKNATTIGILFNGTNEDVMPIINSYVKVLEQQKKKVTTLGFIDTNHPIDALNVNTFARKQVNWLFIPNHPVPLDFLEKPFDILINIFLEESATLEYISTFSKAKFRVGPYFSGKNNCFDFMLNGGDSIASFIQQIHHYLEIIDNNGH